MALRSRLAIDRITILGETASTQANVLPAQVCSDAANRRLRLSSVPVAQNPKIVLDGRRVGQSRSRRGFSMTVFWEISFTSIMGMPVGLGNCSGTSRPEAETTTSIALPEHRASARLNGEWQPQVQRSSA